VTDVVGDGIDASEVEGDSCLITASCSGRWSAIVEDKSVVAIEFSVAWIFTMER
jgi:hypothetical protein